MEMKEKIEIILKKMELSNSGLEKKLSLSNGYIASLLERTTNNPGKMILPLISKCGISVDWFLVGEGDDPFLPGWDKFGFHPDQVPQEPIRRIVNIEEASPHDELLVISDEVARIAGKIVSTMNIPVKVKPIVEELITYSDAELNQVKGVMKLIKQERDAEKKMADSEQSKATG